MVHDLVSTHYYLLNQRFSLKEKYKAWGCTHVREREDRLTDRRGQEGNEERRNVKAGALEMILAGNSSNHGDMVNTL